MRAWLGVIVLAAVALASVHAGVRYGHDRSWFVSPPESVVEEFALQLSTHRFERATPFLSNSLRSRVGADSLQRVIDRVERSCGTISQVHGEPNTASITTATAYGIMRAKHCETRLSATLEFEKEWRIAAFSVETPTM